MINRRKLRRIFAPTVDIGGAVLVAVFGVSLLLAGFLLSFGREMRWVADVVKSIWNRIVSSFGPVGMDYSTHLLGGAMLVLGIMLTVVGIRTVLHRIFRTISPNSGPSMTSVYMRRMALARGPKIVVIGGGTGLSTLLRGLKQYTSNIAAIVTVTDDGGSSGRLSEELGIIPPGDIRNCLVALADAEKLMTDLFQYRFRGQSRSLSGHSLGNLLIAGLIEQSGGDFERALNMASEVLAIRGRVMPSTLERVRLRALLEDGSEVCGETNIVAAGGRIRRMFIDPEDAHAFPEALQAIRDAEIIVVGPGSVYTSIVPNLLVPGISTAIKESKAAKAYVCNVMTQPGESQGFTAQEHVAAIEAQVGEKLFEYVLLNVQMPSSENIEKYAKGDQYPVEPDIDRIVAGGRKPVLGNFMSETDYVRHDPARLAESLMKLVNR